jgi:hypothetical protein
MVTVWFVALPFTLLRQNIVIYRRARLAQEAFQDDAKGET